MATEIYFVGETFIINKRRFRVLRRDWNSYILILDDIYNYVMRDIIHIDDVDKRDIIRADKKLLDMWRLHEND